MNLFPPVYFWFELKNPLYANIEENGEKINLRDDI